MILGYPSYFMDAPPKEDLVIPDALTAVERVTTALELGQPR